MEGIKNIKNVSLEDIEAVGKKAAYLGELAGKYNVPPGYVLTKDVYNQFIESNQLKSKIRNLLAIVDSEDEQRLQDVANEIQKLILSCEFPKETQDALTEAYYSLNIKEDVPLQQMVSSDSEPVVVVRTSPTEQAEGAHVNLIHVKGKDKLLKSVTACFASFFTAKAIKNRAELGIRSSGMPVIIQKMIMPHISGYIEKDAEEIILHACFGLREKEKLDKYVVSDKLEIKTVSVEKQKTAIMHDSEKLSKTELSEAKAGTQKLSDQQILTLARLYKKAVQSFDFPISIEFIIDKHNYYFVQAVEIPKEEAPEEEAQSEDTPEPEPEKPEEMTPDDEDDEIQIDINEEPEIGEDAPPVKEEKTEEEPNAIFQIFKSNKSPDEKPPEIKEPVLEPKTEVAPAPVPVKKPAEIHPLRKEEWLETLRWELSKNLMSFDMIIVSALKSKYKMLYDDEPPVYEEIIEKLKEKTTVPMEEEIKRIRALRNRFLEQHKPIKMDELDTVYKTTERFLKEF